MENNVNESVFRPETGKSRQNKGWILTETLIGLTAFILYLNVCIPLFRDLAQREQTIHNRYSEIQSAQHILDPHILGESLTTTQADKRHRNGQLLTLEMEITNRPNIILIVPAPNPSDQTDRSN